MKPFRLDCMRDTLMTLALALFVHAAPAQNIPAEKYHKEELELINGVYPGKKLPVGEYIKVVE